MKAKIIFLEKEINEKVEHNSFLSRGNTIWLFSVRLNNTKTEYRCGSNNKIPPYAVGDDIEYTILKGDYISIKKESKAFKSTEKPLVNNNSAIAIASTTLAINILDTKGDIDFKAKETIANDKGSYVFGSDDVKRFSRTIAEVMIDTQLYLDSK